MPSPVNTGQLRELARELIEVALGLMDAAAMLPEDEALSYPPDSYVSRIAAFTAEAGGQELGAGLDPADLLPPLEPGTEQVLSLPLHDAATEELFRPDLQ